MNPVFARVFVTIANLLLTYGLWAQVIKMYRTKSTQDFATVTVVSWLIAEIAWLNYGISIHEWPMILLGASNVPAAVAAVIGYFKYRGARRPRERQM